MNKIIQTESITNDKTIISILEIQGLKFTSRNFQIEIELKQSMVVSPDPFLDECFNSDGTFVQKDYPKIVSKDTCRWCPYNNLPNLCNKNIEQKQFFS